MSATLSQNLNNEELTKLVAVARSAIHNFLYNNTVSMPDFSVYPERLTIPAGCFVTLKVAGELQGCLGTILPRKPLAEEIHEMAIASAHRDHRFAPLNKTQLPDLTVEVSVLSAPEKLSIEDEESLLRYLDMHKVGVILSDEHHQALFLPQVWEQLPEPASFIKHLKLKAGWLPTYWSESISVEVFDVVNLEEKF